MEEFRSAVDLTIIMDKLEAEGLVHRTVEGIEGWFCMPQHKHLLTTQEFDTFVELLHISTPSHASKCTGSHKFVFKKIDESKSGEA